MASSSHARSGTMKRASESPGRADREREKFTYRRQNPVSCQFCRSKKLKCDREQPCGSCSARGISCVPALGNRAYEAAGTESRANPPNPLTATVDPSVAASLDERLRRIEQIFLPEQIVTANPPWLQQGPGNFQGWYRDPKGGLSRSGNYLNPELRAAVASSTLKPPNYSLNDDGSARDMGQNFSGDRFSSDIPQLDNLVYSQTNTPQSLTAAEISMAMPNQSLAEVLLYHYVENLNWVYKLIHVPTVHSQLKLVYEKLAACSAHQGDMGLFVDDRQKSLIPGLALIMCILASAANIWMPRPDVRFTKEESTRSCKLWSGIMNRALIESRSEICPTLESLQATIIKLQFIPGHENSAKRTFLAATIHMAHTLHLHQIDSRRNVRLRENAPYDLIDLEVKRRIWWHITTTDWAMSYMSGPQIGTYLVHPDQMNVLYPANSDDADMTPQGVYIRDFNSAPTEMTYHISKIWMAQLLRELVDTATRAGLEVDELEYEQVMEFDRKFIECNAILPDFLQNDEARRSQSQFIDRERPYIAWQRNMVHFGLHTRLSRLHRSYLVRGYRDPKYAYSRKVCLRSARAVIDLTHIMQAEAGRSAAVGSSQLWIIIHHYFMATVTLVMDYCYYRNDPGAAEKKAEILNCYHMLERSQEASEIARTGLQQLKRVMEDWREGQSARPSSKAGGRVGGQGQGQTQGLNAGGMGHELFQQPSQSLNNNVHSLPSGSSSFAGSAGPLLMDMGMGVAGAGSDELGIFDNLDFTNPFDPQWEALFWNLDNMPGMYD